MNEKQQKDRILYAHLGGGDIFAQAMGVNYTINRKNEAKLQDETPIARAPVIAKNEAVKKRLLQSQKDMKSAKEKEIDTLEHEINKINSKEIVQKGNNVKSADVGFMELGFINDANLIPALQQEKLNWEQRNKDIEQRSNLQRRSVMEKKT